MIRKLALALVAAALAVTACGSPPTPATAQGLAPRPTATRGGDDVRTYNIQPEQSTVSYAVGETLFNQGNRFNVAVGVTNAINGQVFLNFTHPEQSTVGAITVDVSALKSDSSRRDSMIRRNWLESQKYPIVTFAPTAVNGLPSAYIDGTEINFEIVGDMTVRDATKPVAFSVTAKLQDGSLGGTATATIKMSDFNFQAPDIAGILKAEDQARLEFKFVATSG